MRKAEGFNVSSADATFMNDAKMVNLSFDDLVKGSGPHQGYTNMEKMVTTVLALRKRPELINLNTKTR